jgi:glutamate/tyrosine decarboxylase-like PLP-dependent enzyme
VIGGGLPAALAADWLTAAWDQNAGSTETPAAAAAEQVALRWVLELLDLPRGASGAVVTGAQMAHVVGLAAARGAVLRAVGWDVERDGLRGSPPIDVVVGADRHDTLVRALRFLGLGEATPRAVACDRDGRMLPGALDEALASAAGATIVCAQAGEVHTGAMDPMAEIAEVVDRHRRRLPAGAAWLHVDGAFGLWARACPPLRPLLDGVERADSWVTDAHKILNVPYDCGIALFAHP